MADNQGVTYQQQPSLYPPVAVPPPGQLPVQTMVYYPMPPSINYDQDLLGCFDDFETCCLTTLCTPCMLSDAYEKAIPHESCIMWALIGIIAQQCGCCACYAYKLRGDISRNYNITTPDDVKELMIDCFCYPCAACQEVRQRVFRRDFGNLGAPPMYATFNSSRSNQTPPSNPPPATAKYDAIP